MCRKNHFLQVELAFSFNSASNTASGKWAERITTYYILITTYYLFLWEMRNMRVAVFLFKSAALATEDLRAGVRHGNAWKICSMSVWGWWFPGLAHSVRAWENRGQLLASSPAPGGQVARGAFAHRNLPIPFAQSAMEIPLKLRCKHVPATPLLPNSPCAVPPSGGRTRLLQK